MDSISINTGGAIDVSAIVTALMEIEQQPLNRLEARAQGVSSTISQFGRLSSALSSFQDAARGLKDADTWRAASGSSSDDTAVDIAATSGALQGSFAVQVNQLASNQTIVSGVLGDSSAVMGGGTLTVDFAQSGASPVDIVIPAGATLAEASAAINSADVGIGASLVTDADGTRMMIRSTQSGVDQGFSLSAASDGSGQGGLSLNSLAYSVGQTTGDMTRTQTAANAQFELNGLALESETNQPEGILENVSLTLRAVTTAPVEVEVSSDAEQIRTNVDTFISAYNELNSLIKEQTRYDAETQTAGPLQGNRTVLLIQDRMRDVINSVLPDSGEQAGYTRLSNIGFEVQRDGSLSLDESKFEVASASTSKLFEMFGGTGVDSSGDGFARKFDTLITDLLGVDGAITSASDTLRARQDSIGDEQDRLLRRLDDIESRLIRQYTNLDANMARLQSALSTVSQIV